MEAWRNLTPGQRVKVAEKTGPGDGAFSGMTGRFISNRGNGYALVVMDCQNQSVLLHPESLEPTDEPRKPLVVPQLQGGR